MKITFLISNADKNPCAKNGEMMDRQYNLMKQVPYFEQDNQDLPKDMA